MRVLHFSDIHLPEPLVHVPWKDWLGKRAFGGLNLLLGRGRHFAGGPAKMAALDRFRQQHQIDLVICTGDYTSLGTWGELRAARRAIEPLLEAHRGYVHVPGNHDIYTTDAVRDRRFVESFGDTLATDLPEYCVEDDLWPIVRLVDARVAVVAVDSARPNLLPWQSSGQIPTAQLAALGRILDDERICRRFVFVITHYSPRLEDGSPDRPHHGLVNADDFLAVCRAIRHGAILGGHVHRRYVVRAHGVPASLFCAGSTTKDGVEGLWVFDIHGPDVRATPGRWIEDRYSLDHESAVDF